MSQPNRRRQTSSSTLPTMDSAALSVSSQQSRSHGNNTHHHQHAQNSNPEERLAKSWRTLANCFIVGTQKAEKAARIVPPDGAPPAATTPDPGTLKQHAALLKELDDYILLVLRTRSDWARCISHLEATLEGTAQEMETIQHYHRTTPVLFSSTRPPCPSSNGELPDNLAAVDAAAPESGVTRKRKEPPGEDAQSL